MNWLQGSGAYMINFHANSDILINKRIIMRMHYSASSIAYIIFTYDKLHRIPEALLFVLFVFEAKAISHKISLRLKKRNRRKNNIKRTTYLVSYIDFYVSKLWLWNEILFFLSFTLSITAFGSLVRFGLLFKDSHFYIKKMKKRINL